MIQLNFEKTCGVTDWLANVVEFGDKYYDAIDFEGSPLQLRVHGGWAAMYLAAKREIRARWQALQAQHPEAATEVVGWSLGSGLAMLCAQDLNYNFGVRPYVYSFGSVRPFRSDRTNDAAMRRYLSGVCTACWNFADCNDVITYMPPFRGFQAIRRVELAEKKRNFFRLLNPWRYHTCYDKPALYEKIGGETQKTVDKQDLARYNSGA